MDDSLPEDPIRPTMVLDTAQLAINRQATATSLIGNLCGKWLSLKILARQLPSTCNLFGEVEILELQNHFFPSTFSLSSDMECVRKRSPWSIANQQFIITGWVPNFVPKKVYIAFHSIWVILRGLPIEYRETTHLRQLVQPLGQLRQSDEVTLTKGKSSGKAPFAHVQVEMDLNKSIQRGIKIQHPEGEQYQPLKYEDLTLLCLQCQRLLIRTQLCIFCHNQLLHNLHQPRKHQHLQPLQLLWHIPKVHLPYLLILIWSNLQRKIHIVGFSIPNVY